MTIYAAVMCWRNMRATTLVSLSPATYNCYRRNGAVNIFRSFSSTRGVSAYAHYRLTALPLFSATVTPHLSASIIASIANHKHNARRGNDSSMRATLTSITRNLIARTYYGGAQHGGNGGSMVICLSPLPCQPLNQTSEKFLVNRRTGGVEVGGGRYNSVSWRSETYGIVAAWPGGRSGVINAWQHQRQAQWLATLWRQRICSPLSRVPAQHAYRVCNSM